jgi:hypothetical protein
MSMSCSQHTGTPVGSVNRSACSGSAPWLSFVLAFTTLWIGILAHEAAHFGVAALLHYQEHLARGDSDSAENLAVVAAGPLTTILILAVCALMVTLRSRRDVRTQVSVALGFGAASRSLLIGLPILFGRGANDEITISQLLGISPRGLWIVEVTVVATMLWLVARGLDDRAKPRALRYLSAGIVAGWLSLFTIGRAMGLPI